ncbi:MAG: T9SS type A sorting domain-containing protein [bacterium]
MRRVAPAGSMLLIATLVMCDFNPVPSSVRAGDQKNARVSKGVQDERVGPFIRPPWVMQQAEQQQLSLYSKTHATSAVMILWEDDFEGGKEPWTPVASWTNTPVNPANPDAGFVFSDHSGWTRVDTVTQEPPSPAHAWRNDDDENTAIDLLISPVIHLPQTVAGEPLRGALVRFFLDLHTPDAESEGNLQDFFYVRAGRADALWKLDTSAPFSGHSHWSLRQHPADASGAFNVQSLTSPEIDLGGAVSPVLTYVQQYATEPNFDYCAVEISTDRFKTYKTLTRHSGIRATYDQTALNLKNHAGKKIRLRFRFVSDFGFSQPNARWFLDDIVVKDSTRIIFSDQGGDNGRTRMVKWGFVGGDRFIGLDYDQDSANPAAWWIKKDSTNMDRGSLNVFDSAAGVAPGDSIRLAFHWVTNGRVANGNGRGIFIDDVAIEAVTGIADDVAMLDLDVAFPNVESFAAQPAVVRVRNRGFNNQNAVPVRYRLNGGPVLSPLPGLNFDLAGQSEKEGPLNWKSPVNGIYTLAAFADLVNDSERANDSLSVAPIAVYPRGIAELGYDDRFNQDAFITASKSLVSFTVKQDLPGLTENYTLHQVKLDLFNGSNVNDQVRVVVATASNDTTLQTILFEKLEPVPARDFSAHILYVNAKDLNAERFVVLVDFSVGNGNARLRMGGQTPFTGRNYFFDGRRWSPSNFGRQIRSRISWLAAPKIVAVRDVPGDQGRQAQVNWFPSPSETFSRGISSYILWRAVKQSGVADTNFRVVEVLSMPALHEYGIQSGRPGDRLVVAGNRAWDFLANVPVSPGFDAYAYLAPTLIDSNTTGRNYTTYMISAYNKNGVFVVAKTDSGYSVDNIPPTASPSFTATRIAVNQRPAVQLKWQAVADNDLAHYAIYKSGGTAPLATTTGLSFTDLAVVVGTTVSYGLAAVDVNGNQSVRKNASLLITRVEERPQAELPSAYELGSNYPNPFNPQTTIDFALPERGHVKLVVFNFLGQEVETLVDAEMSAGIHKAMWDAKQQPSGIYFYRLTVNDFTQIKKMVLMQ